MAETVAGGRSTADGGTGTSTTTRTSRTGELGGIPAGRPTLVKGDALTRRSLEMENSGAVTIAEAGYRIHQNPTADEVAAARQATGDTGDPKRNPDYLLEGRVFAERALPIPGERPTGKAPFLSAHLAEIYGFDVTIRTGRSGYVDALADDGQWEWEPDEFVSVSFHLDKIADSEHVAINVLTLVRRLLTTGPEDAALVLNGDILILDRFDGHVGKHNRAKWWSYYPAAEQLFPG